MSKRDLLIEIGLEEMPARFVSDSIAQLTKKVEDWLTEKKLSFETVKGFSTPRRLAVLVVGVAEQQNDIEEEAKGPARKIALDDAGNWSKAAIGFTKGQGMSVEDIYFKEINGIEYVHVNKFIKGQLTKTLLVELEKIVTGLTFPKNMRWANEDMRYIRPIKWLVALFGNEVIPFSIANVHTDRKTYGHRFLGSELELSEPSQYEEKLLGEYVVVDAMKRKEAIVSQIKQLEEDQKWSIPMDGDLLEEVNNLVEYPTALFGRFEEEFLQLPEEVLITSMKEHQRYFPVKDEQGKLLSFFVTVRNGDHNHLEKVAKGNEKVLRARLADAQFFYKEDQKTSIENSLKKLQTIVYHEEIGTLAEKVIRIRTLTNNITEMVSFSDEDQKAADRASEISKFDLVSHMVYEFPELQGFMGEKYALQKGESPLVASAINEHYMPRSADDSTPNSNAGAAVSVADKLDTITSCFAIGIIPTGSQDPYALRRQAAGIVQILLDHNWNLKLEELIASSLKLVVASEIAKRTEDEILADLLAFFKMRIKFILQEHGVRYDLIDAVLAGEIGNVSSLIERAKILQEAKDEAGFKEQMESLSRVLNIASKATNVQSINEELFENDFEKSLFTAYLSLKEELVGVTDNKKYYQLLTALRPSIDAYFEHTMVMAKEEEVKQNRLSFMHELATLIRQFANMNDILVK